VNYGTGRDGETDTDIVTIMDEWIGGPAGSGKTLVADGGKLSPGLSAMAKSQQRNEAKKRRQEKANSNYGWGEYIHAKV